MINTIVFDDSDRLDEELSSANPVEVGEVLDLPNTMFDDELSAYVVISVSQKVVKVCSL